ncbi:hypothetical protein BH11ACT6_BH11ACT6_12030 [soil metagenome]
MKRALSILAGVTLTVPLLGLTAPQRAAAETSTYCEIVNVQITMHYDPVPCGIVTQLGQTTCTSLANGSDWPATLTATQQAAKGFLGAGPGNAQAVSVLSDIAAAHAINMLCPEHLSRLG